MVRQRAWENITQAHFELDVVSLGDRLPLKQLDTNFVLSSRLGNVTTFLLIRYIMRFLFVVRLSRGQCSSLFLKPATHK